MVAEKLFDLIERHMTKNEFVLREAFIAVRESATRRNSIRGQHPAVTPVNRRLSTRNNLCKNAKYWTAAIKYQCVCVFEQLASVRKFLKLQNESTAVRPIVLSLLPVRKAFAMAFALRPSISPTL